MIENKSQTKIIEKIDTTKIYVLDDFVPKWFVKALAKQSEQLEWKYGWGANFGQDQRFFVKKMFDRSDARQSIPQEWNNYMYLFDEMWRNEGVHQVMPDAEIMILNRSVFNGQLPCTPGGPHQDSYDTTNWTFIYYVNDSTGDTAFYNEDGTQEIDRVEFKQGRCIWFPSWYPHAGLGPQKGFRISFAMTYHVETKNG